MLSLFRRSARVLVEPLSPDAADDCARIHRGSFAHSWSAAELGSMIASAGSIADGALDESGRSVRGFVISRQVLDEAELLTIAVDASCRRHGMAAMLLEHHLERLRFARVCRLFLEVSVENEPARALYVRFGFQEVGQRAGYYRLADGSRATALVLSRKLI